MNFKDKILRKNWNCVALEFDLYCNSYSVLFPGISIEGATVKAEMENGKFSDFKWALESETEKELSLTAQNSLGKWLLKFSGTQNHSGQQGISIALSVEPAAEFKKLVIKTLSVSKFEADHIFVHGKKMGGCRAYKLPIQGKKYFESFFQTMITQNGYTLQIASALMLDYPSMTAGTLQNNFIRDLFVASVVSPSLKQKIDAEPVILYASKKGHSLMIDWAKDNLEKKKEIADPKHGWNTWDYYRWTITEEEVLKNAGFIASDPVLSKHIKRIIIDDGWQYCYGEWDANPLFPSGMKSLADKLNGMGFEAGLWFAPTIIEPHSRIAQVHSDMLAMGESGLPCLAYECMKRKGFVLDPTKEKVQKWLFDLFQRYTEMGYKYFKLDFLYQTLKAPHFHDKSVPKGKIMRKIMEPIYNASKGKASILGCNFQFEGGTKYVDDVRVSGDIHSSWHAIETNVVSVAGRFWSNDILWRNDPDFALCRGPETSNDPNLERLRPLLVYVTPEAPLSKETEERASSFADATYEESKILLSIAILSGGTLNLSDNLPRLNEKGLDLARKTVSAKPGKAAIPMDLFKAEKPSYWLQEVDGGVRVLMINWLDKENELIFNLEKHAISFSSAKNFWTGEDVPLLGGKIRTVLKPHSCLLTELN
jgi:melibiase-like protein